jgi:hypothetical protein
MIRDTIKTCLRPNTSDQRPYSGVKARLVRRYAVATHALSLPECKSEAMRGSAVATLHNVRGQGSFLRSVDSHGLIQETAHDADRQSSKDGDDLPGRQEICLVGEVRVRGIACHGQCLFIIHRCRHGSICAASALSLWNDARRDGRNLDSGRIVRSRPGRGRRRDHGGTHSRGREARCSR